jgi:hypothetical protein
MKRLLPSGIAGILALAVLAIATVGTAVAYFTASGAGDSSPAVVTAIAKPTITTATPANGGTVALTWTAVTPPGPGIVTYSISRNGENANGTCSSPLTAVSCTDSGLEPGTYNYVVTAKWRSWTAASPTKATTVTVGRATRLTLTAASSAPSAGGADNLTIAATDAGGGTVTTYTGSHSLTFSGAAASPGGTAPTVSNSSGTDVAFGAATAIAFTAGVATVNTSKNGAMKLYKSGPTNINVSDGTLSTATPLEVTVSPLAASKFVISAATTTPAAGATDNLTTTAQDTYGNVATAYTGSKSLTFSGASSSPNGTAPTVSDSSGANIAFGSATTINFTAGIATVSAEKNGVMKLYKGGSTSLIVTDGTLLTPTALTVTVGTTATRLGLAAATTSLAAGAADNLTITALDIYENPISGYTGAKNLTFSGAATVGANKPTVANSAGTATAFGTATTITFTAGVATVTTSKNGLMKIYAAGEAAIEVSDGSISTAAPLKVAVSPLAASKFVLTANSVVPTVGEADNLTTAAQDTYGNVATTYTGSHSLTFSGASASPTGINPTVSDSAGADVVFGSATAINFNAGVATASGAQNGVMKLYKTGSTSLTATDGTLLTPTALVVTVAPGAAIKFAFSASATSLVAGGSSNLTTTAQDSYGNTVTTYAGSHNLTYSSASTSPNATAPTVVNGAGTAVPLGTATAITFTSGVASVATSKNGLLKLYKAESPSISVSDGSISSAAPIAFAVTPTAATRWALSNVSVSAGALGSPCLFTCTLTGLGNSGTVKAKVAVTDAYGNTISALGTGHAAKVTTNGSGTISGTPLAIPSTGAAESGTTFTFTSKASGAFTEILTVAASEGTAYTAATLTASK